MEKSGARSDGKAHRLRKVLLLAIFPSSAQKTSFCESSKPLILRCRISRLSAAHNQVLMGNTEEYWEYPRRVVHAHHFQVPKIPIVSLGPVFG